MTTGLSAAERNNPKPTHGGIGGRGPGSDKPDFGGGGDSGGGDFRSSPSVYQIGMIAALFSIATLFIALVLAYGLQLRAQSTWQRVHIPAMLWVSTALLAASSTSFEVGRRALRHGFAQRYIRSLGITILLGLAFIASQLLSWQELKQQGVYVEANLHGEFSDEKTREIIAIVQNVKYDQTVSGHFHFTGVDNRSVDAANKTTNEITQRKSNTPIEFFPNS